MGAVASGKLTIRGFIRRQGTTLIEDSRLGDLTIYMLLRRLSVGLLQMLLARGERGFDRLSCISIGLTMEVAQYQPFK